MNMRLGFGMLAGLAVLAVASFTSTAQAQCSNGYGGDRGGYGGGSYAGGGYSGGGSYYAAPRPQYYAPPVYQSSPRYYAPAPVIQYSTRPAYRSHSSNFGSDHRHGDHHRRGHGSSHRGERHHGRGHR